MMTNEWVIRVVLATEETVSDTALEKMADAADERDATVARRELESGVVVTMDVDVSDGGGHEISAAIDWSLKLVRDVGGCEDAVPADVRYMTLDAYEAEALRPSVPELASAADVAEILGVSRQRVHQLATSNPRFPQHIARVATGPLWARSSIEWFDSVWERKAGRPAKLAAVSNPRPRQPVRAEPTSVLRGIAAAASKVTAWEKRPTGADKRAGRTSGHDLAAVAKATPRRRDG
ncbi:hypothetical protein [Amycolatopsis sp. lyj-23]|uniref:hypothetical protein n=1 Tax=Amycolatopsis sp. lyj-23 TaxID=2789283 RepID=UPI00397CFB34